MSLPTILGLIVVAAPVLLVAILGVSSLFERRLSEHVITKSVQACILTGLIAALTILGWMLLDGSRRVPIELGHWVAIPHYHFTVKIEFDRLSVPFVILTFLLCGVIGSFASSYMHREPGFNRFFMLFAIFVLGMIVTSLAGTIETLFAGWELVGLSSAMLVAFYHERLAPVRNGLRVWIVYRISDAALLTAAVVLHHVSGHGDFDALMGKGTWPEGAPHLTQAQASIVGLLLLIAAAGKSALVPFSGWLPRAMEGPTPSSAVFYGALSVHLGAFLLLRIGPVLELSPWLSATVVAIGVLTAIFAAITERVQTDIKCALSFASLMQVGIIVAEIGLGLRYVALCHILGHGCLRTLQFLRAPTLLLDYRRMEDALGTGITAQPSVWSRWLPDASRSKLYRLAMERGHLDTMLNNFIVAPFLRMFQSLDHLEQWWILLLAGQRPSSRNDEDSSNQLPTRQP